MKGKDLAGSGRDLIETLSRDLLGGTEKTHENTQFEQSVPCRDSNPEPAQYEARTSPLQGTDSTTEPCRGPRVSNSVLRLVWQGETAA
jgi:hypothetical protein